MSSAFWLGWRCLLGLTAFSKTALNMLRTCIIENIFLFFLDVLQVLDVFVHSFRSYSPKPIIRPTLRYDHLHWLRTAQCSALVTYPTFLQLQRVFGISGAIQCQTQYSLRQCNGKHHYASRQVGGECAAVVVVLLAQIEPTLCRELTAQVTQVKAGVGVAVVAGRMLRPTVRPAG